MKHKLTFSLVALGLVGIIGIAIGFGINAALDSGDSLSIPATATPAEIAAPHPTPASGAQDVSTDVTVEPDPDYESALRSARISRSGWKTDFSRHTVPYSEILSGGPPRDGIPPLDNPKFTAPEDASAWLGDQEPVIALERRQGLSSSDTHLA